MAFTYLDYVNKILVRLNEVPLTSGTFAGATGFAALVKEAVNSALYDANKVKFEWPFNMAEGSTTCVAGTRVYSLPATTKTVDWQSFYVNRDMALARPQPLVKLENMDLTHYLESCFVSDVNGDTDARTTPRFIVRSQKPLEFILSPIPNQAYTIKFDYWVLPVSLALHSDTPTWPDVHQEVILNGAMFYTELFRQNFEAANIYEAKFKDSIKDMTRILIPVDLYVRDTRTGGEIRGPFFS